MPHFPVQGSPYPDLPNSLLPYWDDPPCPLSTHVLFKGVGREGKARADSPPFLRWNSFSPSVLTPGVSSGGVGGF